MERPPRDVDELRLMTLTDDTARFLNDMISQAGYDEYLHIGCYALFAIYANTAIGEGMDALSSGPALSTGHPAAVALIKSSHRTHAATEEAAYTRLGFLCLTKGEKTARIRTGCSPNSPTSVSVAHALPRSPAHWMRCAKRSSTKRSRLARMPPAGQQLEHCSRSQRQISHPDKTPRPRRWQPTSARPQPQEQQQMLLLPELSQATGLSHPRRSDCVARRADSCAPSSNYMRHRVRLRWMEWEHIGASGQVMNSIRHSVRVKFKNGLRPKPFNHGVSMKSSTQP
jgi:hypothetical protein